MTWTPISGTPPQYQATDGSLASAYYIKFYAAGTTTPINMATNASAVTLIDKAQLNNAGYPVNPSGDVFVPHIDQTYKLVLYTNATDADANNTANADWVVDNLSQNASVSPTQVLDREDQLGSAASGQVFTLTGFTYTVGINNLLVYRNGQLLRNGPSFDYTETSNTTVTINSSITIAPDDVFSFVKGVTSTSTAIDALNVSYTPAGSGAVATNVRAKLRETVSVKDFGAVGDGSTDDTAAIQAALDAHDDVYVPPGTYRCDTMINLNSGKALRLAGGATIIRTTASASTDPVIWVRGSTASIIGAGQTTSVIRSQNKAPNGVVLVGHFSMATSHDNVTYNTLMNFDIQGQKNYGQTSGDPDVALLIQNPQLSGYAVYFQTITGLRLANANYGLWLRGWANANTISNIQGYLLGDDTVNTGAMVFDNGALDNSFVGAFFHQSPNSVGLKMEQLDNTTNGGVVHQTYASSYHAFVCEQGGANARGIVAQDGTVDGSWFDIRHNVSGGNLLDSNFKNRNTFFGLDSLDTVVKAFVAAPKEISFLNDDDSVAGVKERGYSLRGMTENTTYKVLTVSPAFNSSNLIVQLTIADEWGSGIPTDSAEKATFAVKRDPAGTVTVELIEHNKMGNSGTGKGLVVPSISGVAVDFSYLAGNNGTGTTNQDITVKATIIGASSGITYHQTLVAGTLTSVIRGEDRPKYFNNQVLASSDDTHSLGAASNRWSEVFAGSGTINTSDEREKTAIEPLSDSEKSAALEIRACLGKFKWLDAINKKGDKARVHFGVGAQTLETVFRKHGLDPNDYGVFCFDEWFTKDGDKVSPDQAGAVRHSRYGVRYDELFCFILASF